MAFWKYTHYTVHPILVVSRSNFFQNPQTLNQRDIGTLAPQDRLPSSWGEGMFLDAFLPRRKSKATSAAMANCSAEAGPSHQEPAVVLPMSHSLAPREACHCGLCPEATGRMALRSCGCDRGTCEWCVVQRCEQWDSRDGCHCEPCTMCQNEATQVCDGYRETCRYVANVL